MTHLISSNDAEREPGDQTAMHAVLPYEALLSTHGAIQMTARKIAGVSSGCVREWLSAMVAAAETVQAHGQGPVRGLVPRLRDIAGRSHAAAAEISRLADASAALAGRSNALMDEILANMSQMSGLLDDARDVGCDQHHRDGGDGHGPR